VACCHQRPPLPNLPWVMRWLHLLPQPNTFPDVQSNFHLKLHNHGIKVCSLPPPSCLPFSWHKSNIWRSLIPFLGVALFYRYVRVLSSPSTHFQIPAPASPTTFPLLLENRADDSSLKKQIRGLLPPPTRSPQCPLRELQRRREREETRDREPESARRRQLCGGVRVCRCCEWVSRRTWGRCAGVQASDAEFEVSCGVEGEDGRGG
jgi:hypothetical protein